MKASDTQKRLKFIALMQLLYEMADDDVFKGAPFNTRIVRDRCNDLQRSLKKEIWRIYHDGKDGIWKVDDYQRSEDWDRAMLQHAEAAQQMSKFFDVGVALTNLDSIKAEGFSTQLTILIKTYGIEIDED
jgi:hypothetical protein